MHLSRFERRKGTFVSAIVLCAILSYMHTGAVLASVSQTAVLFLFFLKFFFLTKLAQNRQKTCNAARINPVMLESRMALLETKTDKKSGRIVYSRRIYWCACHVRDDDMITGVHVGSLTCKPGFEFISMQESRERMSLRNFVAPRLRHASPLAFAMSSEASSRSEEVV